MSHTNPVPPNQITIRQPPTNLASVTSLDEMQRLLKNNHRGYLSDVVEAFQENVNMNTGTRIDVRRAVYGDNARNIYEQERQAVIAPEGRLALGFISFPLARFATDLDPSSQATSEALARNNALIIDRIVTGTKITTGRGSRRMMYPFINQIGLCKELGLAVNPGAIDLDQASVRSLRWLNFLIEDTLQRIRGGQPPAKRRRRA